MKNFLLAFFVFLLWSVFGMWYYSCIVKELCSDDGQKNTITNIDKEDNEKSSEPSNSSTEKINSNPFELRDKSGNLLFSFPDDIGISANSNSVSLPENFYDFQESVFKYLNENQNKELEISGLINNAEADNNKELGMNRAKFIKEKLVEYGVNADKISIKSKIQDFNYDGNAVFKGGVLFEFKDLSDEKIKAIESVITNKTLYSGFGSKQFAPDNTLQAYALELKNYLNKYPDKKAEIIGHTDSTGDQEANDWYGMERAKNVKRYLETQGIEENRLLASSRGEKEPVETNATIEGRRKNRRIEIKVN